jgi:hypothetical protein
VDEEDDDVVEDAQRLGVGGAGELGDRLDEYLRAEHLAGVQPAVDPHDGFPLVGELAGLGLIDALGQGQAAGDLLVAAQVAVVGRRGDDGHELLAALLGDADAHEPDAVRLALQPGPVAGELLVVGQAVVVADSEAEVVLRRGDARRGWRRPLGGRRGLARELRHGGEQDGQREQRRSFHRPTPEPGGSPGG